MKRETYSNRAPFVKRDAYLVEDKSLCLMASSLWQETGADSKWLIAYSTSEGNSVSFTCYRP